MLFFTEKKEKAIEERFSGLNYRVEDVKQLLDSHSNTISTILKSSKVSYNNTINLIDEIKNLNARVSDLETKFKNIKKLRNKKFMAIVKEEKNKKLRFSVRKTVLECIKSIETGIGALEIFAITNLTEKQIRNAIYHLKKENKIKTIKRGIYIIC
jgi:hypothetical protein